ncbi:His-Xaa-Ser system radical SAM maturase HxsC [Xanthomonas sp. SHU 199]|uniref:His-Xaa-Ser system radical SAM maturase HxsC n=1 Tax=Xanthomonas sp. SHU 199 TaxID=1591174 RepID=UPI0005853FDE|nr:His-Xaa-Ser system radical SAM maturase HxsC [Xanthomonas sp. SHU 199]
MLPLDTKATISGHAQPHLLKVAGLEEIANANHPIERMALDLRMIPPHALSSNLIDLPWAGFVTEAGKPIVSGRVSIAMHGDPAIVRPGDVIELDPLRQKVAIRYRRGAKGNVLFTTERCNSFCLMCSQPPRQVQDDWRVEHLCELIELIDRSESSLAISGGEPTLLGAGLRRVIEKCKDSLPETQLHVLSNGRLLSNQALTSSFEGLTPRLSWGVPLYGDHYALHDYVVQSEGAFAQTVRGLYALEAAKQRVEVRVVLVKPSFERLRQITRFILRNLSFVEHVALMGIEPVGFAKAHYEALWADPFDYADTLTASTQALSQAGMAVSLYNLPLCAIPKDLWPFAKRSISNWKNDYLESCSACFVKDQCGGFFSWVTPQWTSRAVNPIKEVQCLMH